MSVALNHLESLWPPYRGAVLLGAAQESQGRVSNACIAVAAGHVALTLEVHSAAAATITSRPFDDHQPGDASIAGTSLPLASLSAGCPPSSSPALRLTVLLDAVPDGAAKPGAHQMAKFLTKVLGRASEGSEDKGEEAEPPDRSAGCDNVGGAVLPAHDEGLLGDDVPEMLVVGHTGQVVSSQFVRVEHNASPEAPDDEASAGSSLIYACIEGNGLLRLWKWGGERAEWKWSYLNSCNICACREDPIGCRVLTATIVPEPSERSPVVGGSRHRLVWEQEDDGEGAGLGLAFTPASGLHPPRRVWSRRITFDLDGGVGGGDGHGLVQNQHQEQEEEEEDGSRTRSEIALAFSACLLPTAVDALLCSPLGAWMPAGPRVFFNHFATGRLPDAVLPSLAAGPCPCGDRVANGRATDDVGLGHFDVHRERGKSDVFTDSESDPGNGEAEADDDGMEGVSESGAAAEASEMAASRERHVATKTSPARRLFAVHDCTGDLMLYDHPGTMLVVSVSPGGGGLELRRQCALDLPPPAQPLSFVVRFNLAVLSGGGVCSVYDLCTGHLLGATSIPRCPTSAFWRRHRSSTVPPGFGLPCTCGRRRQRHSVTTSVDYRLMTDPVLWASATRGHLVGILTATRVLRVRLPGAETCLAAALAPSSNGDSPSARSVIRYLRNFRRLVGAGDSWADGLLQCVLRIQSLNSDRGAHPAGVGMMELLGHTVAEEERRFAADGNNPSVPMPPWLLMAMMSTAQRRGQASNPMEAHGEWSSPGGDLATTAAESELRNALERRVAESLRSLDSVRALLQDPAGSARQGAEGGGAQVADDRAAERLASLTASLDPATALFEGTLREWLACRRRGKEGGERKVGGVPVSAERRMDSSRQGVGRSLDVEGSPTSNDALVLAFRCEAVGDLDPQDVPFLRFLLEGSKSDYDLSTSWDRDGGGGGGDGANVRDAASVRLAQSSSTFLCLHLAVDDASPLFEVACRALFQWRPRQLPRFVERLARFRAYADEMKDKSTVDDGSTGEDVQTQLRDEHDEGDTKSETAEATGVSGDSVNSSNHERGTPSQGTRLVGGRRDSSPTSADERNAERLTPLRPSSSPRVPLRCTSEDNASDGAQTGDVGGHSGRLKTRTSRSLSRQHSQAPMASPLDDLVAVANATCATPEVHLENSTVPVAAAYFARALACLPPAAEDGKDGSQRRARLSLLMGACMFTEACRLLRARAWEGTGGNWRDDRGAAEAWSAAMRLLSELKRAAAEEEKGEEHSATTAAPPATAAAAGPPPAVGGSVSLQFLLAFEDTLAETVLADSPDRMESVMRWRPKGLTPVAVVRMVRRAAASELSTAAADDARGGQTVKPRGARVEEQLLGNARPHVFSGSTQTLKKCLLLLLEEDTKHGAVGL